MEHEQAMNGAYKSFRINGQGKTDVESYISLVKPKIQKLIEKQVKVLDSAKVQMHMWVMWKKEEQIMRLNDEDIDGFSDEEKQAWQKADKTHEIKVDKCFNSKMTVVFQGSNVEEILQGMFMHIKTQTEHPTLPKSGFTLDHIMHLDIDFHQLELVRGGLHIELLDWIASKKAVINPKNKDEECFKWAVIA